MFRSSPMLFAFLILASIGMILLTSFAVPALAQTSLLEVELRDPMRFVASTEAVLGGKGPSTLDPLTESFLRTRLGHAYTLLDRAGDAQGEYALAWLIYQGVAQPYNCANAAEAVAEYYRSQVSALPRAYALASEERRQSRPFPEFAAGFARTLQVVLLRQPTVVGQEGDLYRVAVEVLARDLGSEGDVETRFEGTWVVQQIANRCTLESAEVRVL